MRIAPQGNRDFPGVPTSILYSGAPIPKNKKK